MRGKQPSPISSKEGVFFKVSMDGAAVIKAANFAAIKHQKQRRKDPEATPYINHPIGVANILVEVGVYDPIVLQAALLHDTVEDTDTTLDEIEYEFGPVVRKIVADVTDDKSLPKQMRKELQISHAASCCDRAKLVKLADKLYNLRDLQRTAPVGWSEQRVAEYFLWAYKVVRQLRGVHEQLENQLDRIFHDRGIFPCDAN